MRKISNPDQKIECSKICFAEVSKCAKRIEKAMAKCGVQLCGDSDDPAGDIIYSIFNMSIPETEKASSYKPSNFDIKELAGDFQKIKELAGDFQKIYTRKKSNLIP